MRRRWDRGTFTSLRLWQERLKLRKGEKLQSSVTRSVSSLSLMKRSTSLSVRGAKICKQGHICWLMITMQLEQKSIISLNFWRPQKFHRSSVCTVVFRTSLSETETSRSSQVSWWTNKLQHGSNIRGKSPDLSKKHTGWGTNLLHDTMPKESIWTRGKRNYSGEKTWLNGVCPPKNWGKPWIVLTTQRLPSRTCCLM